MKTTYTKAEYDDLMARMRKHFPGLCFLANLDAGAIVGPIVNADGTVERISILWNEEIGPELLGICGCGDPDSVCMLFLNAMQALQAFWAEPDEQDSDAKEGDEWAKYIRRSLSLFKRQQNKFVKDMLDIQEGKKVNPTRFKFCDNELLELLVLYDLDKLGWTDHGTSVFGSRLTAKGETALELLELQYCSVESAQSTESAAEGEGGTK